MGPMIPELLFYLGVLFFALGVVLETLDDPI